MKIPFTVKKLYDNFLSMRYKIFMIGKKKPNIIGLDETIEIIINEKKSVSRFGDGELRWMIGVSPNYDFQKGNPAIENRLKEILLSENKSLLVCLPDVFENQRGFVLQNRIAWKRIIIQNYDNWDKYFNYQKTYYDSNISRFYIDRIDKKKSTERFEKLKKIWDKRDVLVVEGEDTRFGFGNDLLLNSKSIKRLICPSENAFEKYDQILSFFEINDEYKNSLILIALGPTATILSFDLSNIGFQAIDIGHLDLEYEWYLSGSDFRTKIVGKYVNEVAGGNVVTHSKEKESKYLNEIIFSL